MVPASIYGLFIEQHYNHSLSIKFKRASMKKYPILFLGHGNPMNVLNPNNPFNQAISDIGKKLPKPRAILMISAHWYDTQLEVISGEYPPLIYDFYGFPKELYQVEYAAKGEPKLADTIAELLHDDGVALNPAQGFDHGMWTVLKYLYPDADIPVVQLSLKRHQSMDWHLNIAKKLKALREMGVLIIGSGNIVHNLRAVQFGGGKPYDWAIDFQQTINQAIQDKDLKTLAHYHTLPNASLAVPTEEHYLPFLYIMAMIEQSESIHLFNDEIDIASISMTSLVAGL